MFPCIFIIYYTSYGLYFFSYKKYKYEAALVNPNHISPLILLSLHCGMPNLYMLPIDSFILTKKEQRVLE